MKEFKVGDKVKHVSVKLDALLQTMEVDTDDHTVIGVSHRYVQLDGDYFPKFDAKKERHSCHEACDVVHISEERDATMVKYFGRFRVSIYSQMSTKRIESKLNREFQKWLNEKISVYGSAAKVNIKLSD